ncbi:MAG: hypothetical protein ACK526_23460, partial [Planctomyces sp.]
YESWMYSKPAVEPSVMLTSETTIHNLIPAIFLTPAGSRLSQRRLVGIASPISTGKLPLFVATAGLNASTVGGWTPTRQWDRYFTMKSLDEFVDRGPARAVICGPGGNRTR